MLPMRRLVCLACRNRVDLVELVAGSPQAIRCGCGRAEARRDGEGWAYTGPAVVLLSAPEGGYEGASERVVEAPDDELTHRVLVGPPS